MYIVTLRFADKTKAAALMAGHKAWLDRGFDEGAFLLAGSLQLDAGGAILAGNSSRADVEARVQADPFVAGGVVTADILEIMPGRTDARLAFLKV